MGFKEEEHDVHDKITQGASGSECRGKQGQLGKPFVTRNFQNIAYDGQTDIKVSETADKRNKSSKKEMKDGGHESRVHDGGYNDGGKEKQEEEGNDGEDEDNDAEDEEHEERDEEEEGETAEGNEEDEEEDDNDEEEEDDEGEADENDNDNDEDGDDEDEDDEEAQEQVLPPKVLPQRETRGRRLKLLIGEAAAQDDEFWGHETWKEEKGDEEWATEDEAHYADSADSDFDRTTTDEEEEELAEAAAQEQRLTREAKREKQRKGASVYQDPKRSTARPPRGGKNRDRDRVLTETRAGHLSRERRGAGKPSTRPLPPPPALPRAELEAKGLAKDKTLLSQEDHLILAEIYEKENTKVLRERIDLGNWKKAVRESKQSSAVWKGNIELFISWASDRVIETEPRSKESPTFQRRSHSGSPRSSALPSANSVEDGGSDRSGAIPSPSSVDSLRPADRLPRYSKQLLFFIDFTSPQNSQIPSMYRSPTPTPLSSSSFGKKNSNDGNIGVGSRGARYRDPWTYETFTTSAEYWRLRQRRQRKEVAWMHCRLLRLTAKLKQVLEFAPIQAWLTASSSKPLEMVEDEKEASSSSPHRSPPEGPVTDPVETEPDAPIETLASASFISSGQQPQGVSAPDQDLDEPGARRSGVTCPMFKKPKRDRVYDVLKTDLQKPHDLPSTRRKRVKGHHSNTTLQQENAPPVELKGAVTKGGHHYPAVPPFNTGPRSVSSDSLQPSRLTAGDPECRSTFQPLKSAFSTRIPDQHPHQSPFGSSSTASFSTTGALQTPPSSSSLNPTLNFSGHPFDVAPHVSPVRLGVDPQFSCRPSVLALSPPPSSSGQVLSPLSTAATLARQPLRIRSTTIGHHHVGDAPFHSSSPPLQPVTPPVFSQPGPSTPPSPQTSPPFTHRPSTVVGASLISPSSMYMPTLPDLPNCPAPPYYFSQSPYNIVSSSTAQRGFSPVPLDFSDPTRYLVDYFSAAAAATNVAAVSAALPFVPYAPAGFTPTTHPQPYLISSPNQHAEGGTTPFFSPLNHGLMARQEQALRFTPVVAMSSQQHRAAAEPVVTGKNYCATPEVTAAAPPPPPPPNCPPQCSVAPPSRRQHPPNG